MIKFLLELSQHHLRTFVGLKKPAPESIWAGVSANGKAPVSQRVKIDAENYEEP